MLDKMRLWRKDIKFIFQGQYTRLIQFLELYFLGIFAGFDIFQLRIEAFQSNPPIAK